MDNVIIKRCPIDENYYRCTSYEELKRRHVVAQGWPNSGDLSFFCELDENEIKPYVQLLMNQDLKGSKGQQLLLALRGLTHIKERMIILGTVGGQIKGVCEIPPDFCYLYDAGEDGEFEYANCIYPVQWVDWQDFCAEKGLQRLCDQCKPITNVNNSGIRDFIRKNWDNYKKTHNILIQPMECAKKLKEIKEAFPEKVKNSRMRFQQMLKEFQSSMRSQEMIDSIKALVEEGKNVVLTGAPGTGKTFLAWQIASAMTGDVNPMEKGNDNEPHPHIGFCQFHPSMDYTDFVEGLRPIDPEDESQQIGFERKDGIFKEFCRKVVNDVAEIGRMDNFKEAWEALLEKIRSAEDQILDIPMHEGRSLPIEMNKLGTGLANRTYGEDGNWIKGRSKFFSREQLYKVYQGERGVPSGAHDNYRKYIIEYMSDNCDLRPFVKGNPVGNEKRQKYVFIIDEINRGDIAKIFGELFFAIDPGYRGIKGRIKTQYDNLIEDDDAFKDGFYVPDNVYIIGTMNDIDRGVESMDFAIRRRFTWKDVKPEETQEAILRSKIKNGELFAKVKNRMDNLNAAISAKDSGLGSAYCIGGAYFTHVKVSEDGSTADFDSLWDFHLEPLLREYLRGQEQEVVDKQMEEFKKKFNDETPPASQSQSEE